MNKMLPRKIFKLPIITINIYDIADSVHVLKALDAYINEEKPKSTYINRIFRELKSRLSCFIGPRDV